VQAGNRKPAKAIKSVADAVREGDGRYAFGQSVYLVVRGRSALWEYQFRQDSRLRTMTLGSAVARVPGDQPVTITDARAKRHSAWIARRNGETLPAAGQAGKRFAQAAKEYLEAHKAEWAPKQYKDHERRLRLHAAPLNARPVNRITVDDMATVLRPIWTGPNHGRGSKLRGLIEMILNAEAVTQPTPAAWSRLQHKLSKKSEETISYPSINAPDLPGLMSDIAKENSTVARAIRFVTLTTCRQMEALGATWREIDDKTNSWIIPASRTKKRIEHAVPLTPEMIACLGPRGADSDFLFPSNRNGHLSHASTGPALAEYKRRDENGEPITLHGMRSTFARWAHAQKKFDKITIDRCLAHNLNKVDEAYYRGKTITQEYLTSETFAMRRELMEAWSAFATSGKLQPDSNSTAR
jgi:integrase